MFVQIINGRVKDPEAIRRHDEQWRKHVMPGAKGFLGSTVGVADDNSFIAFVRFSDEASARANSDRPEQSAWWTDFQQALDGEPAFRESNDIALLFDGGTDKAGFVQVMEGSVADRAQAEAFETPEMLDQLHAARPDLLGSIRAWFGGGKFVDVAYFTSESDARKGEKSEEFSGPSDQYMSMFRDMTFTDLRDPILTSP
jgi:hypothetical protein